MKYLTKFETQAAYEAAESGLILPNVSLTVDNNTVHYNPSSPVPPTPPETRVVAKFNVTDTSWPTRLCSDTTNFSLMEIDGVVQPSVVSEYAFSTEGEHTVKYTLANPTSIGEWAFNNTYFTSIDIPDSVASIGDSAFDSCNFTSIVIPSSVTSLGLMTFYNNSYLESFTVMATTPPSMNSIFGGEMSTPTIYVPSASVETYKASEDWRGYADYIFPIS